MLKNKNIQSPALSPLVKGGMVLAGYLMQEAQKASSSDQLWAMFQAFISNMPVSNWLYIPLAPYENQLSAFGHETNLGPFSATQNKKALSSEVDQVLRETLRSIDVSIDLIDTAHFENLADDDQTALMHGLGVTDLDIIHLVPTFGPKGFNGGFVIIANEAAFYAALGVKDLKAANLDKSDKRKLCDEITTPLGIACQAIHQIYIDRFAEKPELSTPLTPRERDILEGLSRGLSNPEIAACCGLSAHTVNGYLRRIFLKTNAPNRTTAVLKGFATGLIS